MQETSRTIWIIVAALLCASCRPSLEDRVEELAAAKNVWVSVVGKMKKTYQRLGLIVMAVFLAACASQGKIPSREAVDDYVTVAELEEVDRIHFTRRLTQRPDQTYLNDYYVMLSHRNRHYLVEFMRRCYELTDNTFVMPDMRKEYKVIRARLDFIRGCRIKSLFVLNEGQADELRHLGDAPGDALKEGGSEVLRPQVGLRSRIFPSTHSCTILLVSFGICADASIGGRIQERTVWGRFLASVVGNRNDWYAGLARHGRSQMATMPFQVTPDVRIWPISARRQKPERTAANRRS